MESRDSDSEEDGVEYSGMEQPPLTKMLKNILSEYPDDGQILKELIQNAEDAEATEVKVLLDCRHINVSEVNHRRRPYYKYFKSPALYFYNNAVFDEDDWRGIKMLYSSVKELDPLKVGRFGLGFKSVFHITDFPMVVSGGKMLIIDPHQTNPGKVCQTIKLQKLHLCRKMQKDDYMPALNGVFGFNEDTVQNGKYNGTLFRFPLRTVSTELSDNLYTENKLRDLFHTFECEASITLLFLKFLHKMELYICSVNNNMDNSLEPRFSVSISGSKADEVIASRYEFSESVKALNGQLPPQPLNNINLVMIKTEQSSNQITETPWIVVNTYHGGTVSQKLHTLSQDKDLSYSPCVGIAAQMVGDQDFKGHVFCFLPLPLEQQSLTGLPVHVNGYFALSQNRRHVKWPSADQLGSHGHLDKSMQWNECLLTEVLSQTYIYLIEQLIQRCQDNDNPENMVSMVYQVIPAAENVDLKWRIIMTPLLERLLQKPLFFTLCHGGRWITVQDAVFAEFDNYIDSEIQATVRAVVKQYNYNLVHVPCHVWKLVRNNIYKPSHLTQEFVGHILHNSNLYIHCTTTQKLHLLEFLVLGGMYRNVDGLELLPLQSGKFVRFGRNMHPVFSCTENEAKICFSFPDVILKIELSPNVQQILQCIKTQEICQLKAAKESDIAEFIRKTISLHFHRQAAYMEWNVSSCAVPKTWLENIWKYLEKKSLSAFKDLNIVPCTSTNSIALYKLSDLLILESNYYSSISPAISKALNRFSVVVLSNLPNYVTSHPEVMQRYVSPPNSMGVCAVLAQVYNTGNFMEKVSHFNSYAGVNERTAVTRYLESARLSDHSTKTLLSEMEIFRACGSSDFVSISNVRTIAPKERIPVRFPRKLISESSDQVLLAKNLGATVLDKFDMLIEIFIKVQKNFYDRKEVEDLMSYFISNINVYKARPDIMRLAKKIPFVCTCDGSRKMANEVFNPKNKLLKSLLADKSKFPASSYSDHSLKVLRELGMKNENDVTAALVNECAQQLDRKNVEAPLDDSHRKQSESIILFLEKNENLLNKCDEWGTTLKTSLFDLCFVPSLGRPTSYPTVLPWFGNSDTLCRPRDLLTGSTKNQKIVGSTMPLVSEKIPQVFAKCFGWFNSPPGDKIVNHLHKIVSIYESEYKPEIMPLLKEIYITLSDLNYTQQFCYDTECVWTGEGFVEPDKIMVRKCSGDINLEPYMYYLPKEFQNLSKFFLKIGCQDMQTVDILVDILLMVKNKHSRHSRYSDQHVTIGEDLNLTVQILNKLKDTPGDIEGRDIMFPIHTEVDMQLELRPASECHYSNADWLQTFAEEDDEDIVLVHPNIPHDTAEKLGVKSLTESLFSDAEGMEPWGQKEPLTRRIKNLLRDYKDGFSVPKEIVQNAEDARATKVCFLYDERQNDNWKTKLIDEQMAECQGPALWAYNDAVFTKTDLENITKLSAATKEGDSSKIGKFGLGFCSVYNLTDVPCFISGNDIVIFDPHFKYLGKAIKTNNPGIKINLKSVKNKKLIQRMKNQFQPFQGVFNCDLADCSGTYPGTLFRFPLRTFSQAKESDISNTPYTKDEMKILIKIFMEGAGSLLLFSQNINEVNFYHLPANEENPQNASLIHSVSRKMSQAIPASLRYCSNVSPQLTVLEDTSVSLQNFKLGKQSSVQARTETVIITITTTSKGLAKQIKNVSEETSETEWIVAWATGTSESLKMASASASKGILHLASVAAQVSIDGDSLTLKPLKNSPLGFYKKSHFFCFMPLPIASPLPVHINAAFAVSSDRRGLISKTLDDKYSFQSEWNDALMSDAVPNAYLLLLENLKHFSMDQDDDYVNLWPTVTKQNDKLVGFIHNHFYGKIISENRAVFKQKHEWVHFDDCKFLEPSLMNSKVGKIVLAATKHFLKGEGQKVMCISKSIIESFTDSGYSKELGLKMISKIDFFTQLFFPNIHSEYWDPESRNELTLYVINHKQDSLKELLTSMECIPTEPMGRLRKPADIVHPQSKFKNLFSIEDERFIQTSFTAGHNTSDHLSLQKIRMMNTAFPEDLVIQQANTIQTITCPKCSISRTVTLLKYLQSSLTRNETLIARLQTIPVIPVLKKPAVWVFSWKADYQELEKRYSSPCQQCTDNCTIDEIWYEPPCNLFLPENMYLIGTEVMFVDTELLQDSCRAQFLTKLGVKGNSQTDINIETVCKQLTCLCKTVDPSKLEDNQMQLLRRILRESYSYLNRVLKNIKQSYQSVLPSVDCIKEQPILLINRQFIYPHQVAKELSSDCSPYLYGLASSDLIQHTEFLEAIGVKDHFPVNKIMDVVLECQQKWKDVRMSKKNLELMKRLMEVLIGSMNRENLTYEAFESEMKDKEIELCLPDQEDNLVPISKLCIDDDSNVACSVKFVHDIISDKVASSLGVRSKKSQELQEHITTLRFGQKEELTTRIKGILSGYPCDEGILKELLQNADDAEATEVHFMTDFRTHLCENVFDEKWKALQGPALLVYNDSSFSDKDIEGIQILGIGSKRDDPTKTGQYGVGFNAVYHLTDVPSFITRGPNVVDGETLCVLDPNCLYTSPIHKNDPGIQYCNLQGIRDQYKDVFTPYHEQTLMAEKGTVFRLPLRTMQVASKSNLLPEGSPVVGEKEVAALLDKFKESMFEFLLFLKNVKKITVSDISNGTLETAYTVEASISEDERKTLAEFSKYVKSYRNSLLEEDNIAQIPCKQISYTVVMKDNQNCSESWLVLQQIGVDNCQDINPEITKAYRNGKLGLLPLGGVSLPVTCKQLGEEKHLLPCDRRKRKPFTAFCFLPLPIQTGLPFHVNGHFSLDHESRRNLWQDKEDDYKTLWNKMLLERVVSPSVVSGITMMKDHIKCLKDNPVHKLKDLTETLNAYHLLFPKFNDAKDDYWRGLIFYIFKRVVETETELFLSFTCTPSENKSEFDFVFFPVKRSSDIFESVYAYSETEKLYECYAIRIDETSMEKTLKRLGLRILNTPSGIFQSMQQSKVKIQPLTPEYLIKFLKSFNLESEKYKCQIHLKNLNDASIEETEFKNIHNLQEIIRFCMESEKFQKEIYGLPFCLTQDSKLRVFCENQIIFCTRFLSVLPYSPHLFIHESMIYDFGDNLDNVCKKFSIDEFIRYLPDNLQWEKYRTSVEYVPYSEISEEIPNTRWLTNVWTFLENMKVTMENNWSVNRKETKMLLLHKLGPWCLVPCVRRNPASSRTDWYKKNQDILLPLNCIGEILQAGSFTGSSAKSFRKLQLPYINRNVLPYETVLSKIVPTLNHPLEVLDCLYHHRQKINSLDLLNEDCNEILEYISKSMEQILSDGQEQRIIDMIKSLRLHITVHQERTTLNCHWKGLVLPCGIPAGGIDTWAEQAHTILIHQEEKLQKIYEVLKYSVSSIEYLYAHHILPTFHYLPKENHIDHLQYIQNTCLYTNLGGKYSAEQNHLIYILRNLKFLDNGDGVMRMASEFYSPHVELFKMMCKRQEMPPEPYCKCEWKDFMELVGLQVDITEDKFLEFAHSVKKLGSRTITENTEKLSVLLMQELRNRLECHNNETVSKNFLQKVSCIRFVKGFEVTGELCKIYSQYEKGQLISFVQSVLPIYKNLIWTSCTLLPKFASKLPLQKLDYLVEPSVDLVIKHLQNVCGELKTKCKQFDDCFLIDLLSQLYGYILNAKIDDQELLAKLGQMPILFLPSYKQMVTCDRVIIGLDEDLLITPYLFEAPLEFGRYFDLFEKLGTTKKPSCETYARVLHDIHAVLQSNEFNANEGLMIAKAVQGLFNCLSKEVQDADSEIQKRLGVEKLYLPTRQCTLVDSKLLVFSDDEYIESGMQPLDTLSYFLGFEQMGLSNDYMKKEIINSLPVQNRPYLLSSLVKQKLSFKDDLARLEQATILQEFISTREFVEGFIRLIMYDATWNLKAKIKEERILHNLRSIQVIPVTELKMLYTFKEEYVGERELISEYEEEALGDNKIWKFYVTFVDGAEDWISKLDVNMSLLLSSCTQYCFYHSKNILLVLKLLAEVYNPSRISEILNENQIPKYTSKFEKHATCIFEKIGDLVERHWYHMLDNTFSEFEKGEYVAILLESDEDDDEDNEDIYKYAKILAKKSADENGEAERMFIKYKVMIDFDRTEIRYAYELYKFHRKIQHSTEIVPAVMLDGVQPQRNARCLEEIFKEIREKIKLAWHLSEKEQKRVIKRLSRLWHPDKNYGNEVQATEVFKYIQYIVSRLSKGLSVDMEEDVSDCSSFAQQEASSYSDFFDNISRQCNQERQNYEEYSQNQGHSGRHHSTSTRQEPFPHPREARRWMKQARHDIAAATEFLKSAEDVKAYNWICYTCHQSAEKALTALMYNQDAKTVLNRGHNLCTYASQIRCHDLLLLCENLESLVGSYRAMRYPHHERLPSDVYTRQTADQAISLCNQILEKVGEQL